MADRGPDGVAAGRDPATALPGPRCLVWSTDIDVLPLDRVVERRDGYWVVRSPGNPSHYWGNLLLFDEPPTPGDGARWEALFAHEFAASAGVRHRTFAWDRSDGALGAAAAELIAHGYALEQTIGLVASPEEVRAPVRAGREVAVVELDPAPGRDEPLWEQVVQLQVASSPRGGKPAELSFIRARLGELRVLFTARRGGWYAALLPGDDTVVASCGVLVSAGRGRYQSVDTAAAHRRRGIASRLLAEVARQAARRHGARQLVIAAQADSAAARLYASLGFAPLERVAGVCRSPAG